MQLICMPVRGTIAGQLKLRALTTLLAVAKAVSSNAAFGLDQSYLMWLWALFSGPLGVQLTQLGDEAAAAEDAHVLCLTEAPADFSEAGALWAWAQLSLVLGVLNSSGSSETSIEEVEPRAATVYLRKSWFVQVQPVPRLMRFTASVLDSSAAHTRVRSLRLPGLLPSGGGAAGRHALLGQARAAGGGGQERRPGPAAAALCGRHATSR